jgi:hypothetical protein
VYRATGGKPVPFKNGYPVFDQFAYKVNGRAVKFNDIELNGTSRDFDRANAKFREKYGRDPPDDYTWHHHQDCKTLILVPTAINNNVPHTGGASNIKNGKC